MNYQYKARDAGGKLLTGALQATTQADAIAALQAKGLSPLSLRAIAGLSPEAEVTRPRPAFRRRRVSDREIMLTLKQLSGLLTAGVPLDRGLRMLMAAKRSTTLATYLETVHSSVEAGKPLSGSLASSGFRLPAYALSLIKAGELSGDLEEALLTVVGVMERNAQAKAIIKNSLTYPAIMVVASLVSLVLLFTFMLPRFTFVDSLSGASSAYLQFLLQISALLRSLAWPVLILIVAALAIWKMWYARLKEIVPAYLLRAPLVGQAMRVAAASRLLRCLGSLLHGGVTLPQALEAVVDVAGYKAYSQVVLATAERVTNGASVSAVWQQHRLMPAVAVELVKVGEETGDLAPAFLQGADLLEEDLRQWVAKFTATFEPVLILTIAAVVGFVVVSILLPVISLTDIPI